MTDTDVRDMIIIGGGPAGYTAALYAARANLSPLVIEGFNWGGQLMITSEVENYPGYRDGVMGPEMMAEFRAQAARFGAEFVTDDVTRIDLSERPFKVYVGDDEYTGRSIIVATGATARQLGLESERALHGRGVTYCATCDAAFYRDREVVVVGGGDSAMEEALYLTKFASKVTLVHRRAEFRASQIMVDRVKDHERIEILTPFVVEEVLGVDTGKLTGVLLRNVETDETTEYPTDGLFVAIGHDPTGSTTTTTAISSRRGRRRTRTSPASSPQATSRITCTGRRSPQPGPVVPPRSTRSVSSPRRKGTRRRR
jgi:thioredoxin reductase (NADPH)